LGLAIAATIMLIVPIGSLNSYSSVATDDLQNKMQSKSRSKKELSDIQQKYVEWIRQMDKITVTNIYLL
jgi:hypothetical protein